MSISALGFILCRCSKSRVAFPSDLACGFGRSEFQTVCRAYRDAGWFQALINSFHTVIALDNLADFRIPLRCPPRAGSDAGLTAHAQRMINKYYSIPGPFLHRTGRAYSHTPGIIAMKTRDKHIGCTNETADKLGPDSNNLTWFGSCRQ